MSLPSVSRSPGIRLKRRTDDGQTRRFDGQIVRTLTHICHRPLECPHSWRVRTRSRDKKSRVHWASPGGGWDGGHLENAADRRAHVPAARRARDAGRGRGRRDVVQRSPREAEPAATEETAAA
jgi:hypothetical protein